MKYLFSTQSDNEFYNGECDYALVDVTPELATLALKRIEMFKQIQSQDKEAMYLLFHDCSPEWFASFEGIDEHMDALAQSDGNRIEIPTEFSIPEDSLQRTECDERMVVDEESVYWRAVPRHCDFHIETSPVSVTELEAIVKTVDVAR